LGLIQHLALRHCFLMTSLKGCRVDWVWQVEIPAWREQSSSQMIRGYRSRSNVSYGWSEIGGLSAIDDPQTGCRTQNSEGAAAQLAVH